MEQDCYFYINTKLNKVRPVCLPCYDKMRDTPDEVKGWFWEGSNKGYGPFLFKCDFCEKVIHEEKEITPPS